VFSCLESVVAEGVESRSVNAQSGTIKTKSAGDHFREFGIFFEVQRRNLHLARWKDSCRIPFRLGWERNKVTVCKAFLVEGSVGVRDCLLEFAASSYRCISHFLTCLA